MGRLQIYYYFYYRIYKLNKKLNNLYLIEFKSYLGLVALQALLIVVFAGLLILTDDNSIFLKFINSNSNIAWLSALIAFINYVLIYKLGDQKENFKYFDNLDSRSLRNYELMFWSVLFMTVASFIIILYKMSQQSG